MIHVFGTALVWLAIGATPRAADNLDELKRQFDYDPKEALDVREALLAVRARRRKRLRRHLDQPKGGSRDGLPGRGGRQGAA